MLFPNENALVLNCIRTGLGTQTPGQTYEILKGELNWSYILRKARQNNIAPLLYHNLQKLGTQDLISVDERKEFEMIYHSAGFRNAIFYEELKKILRFFEDRGISVIVLKGAVLAEEVFKNVALRQMGDIDLLVQEQDLDKSAGTLTQLGYIPYEVRHSESWYKSHHHHLVPYFNPAKGIAIEIHRNIIPLESSFSIDTFKLWERSQHLRMGNINTKVLSPEDLIIHLCLHLSFCNGFIGGIKTLIDISQAVRHYGERINWNWLIREARERGFANFVFYPLYFTCEILNVDIAKAVLDGLKKGSKSKTFEVRLLKPMIRNILLTDEAFSIFPKGYLALLCKEVLREVHTCTKIASILRKALQQNKGEADNASLSLLAMPIRILHPILRPCNLILKLGRNIIRVIFHKRKSRRESITRASYRKIDEIRDGDT